MMSNYETGLESQLLDLTQTQTAPSHGGTTQVAPTLTGVAEEEEEATPSEFTRGTKRSLDEDAEDDMAVVEEQLQPTPVHCAKRRALNDRALTPATVNANPAPVSKPDHIQAPKRTKSGAPPGQPDTDAAFLKAVASTKKGKKQEDHFDREFNNLRISKPDVQETEREKEWAVLEDFGDDRNIRGNFMVVAEMEIFRDMVPRAVANYSATHPEWIGKPNYKRFKKV